MAKIAVALSGGSSRGSYQVGVWRALRELGIEYSIVTGASIGSLNGAMMVLNDYETTEHLWTTLSTADGIADGDILDQSDENFQSALIQILRKIIQQGGFDMTPFEERIRAGFPSEDLFRKSPVEFGLVTTKFPSREMVYVKKEDIPKGKLIDYLLASCAFYPFLQKRVIDDNTYIDGGYSDNLPANFALQLGAQEVIAVDLQGRGGIIHPYQSTVPVTFIRCHWQLGDTANKVLSFQTGLSKRNLELGYLDGLKAFGKMAGSAYTFHPQSIPAVAQQIQNMQRDIYQRTTLDLLAKGGKLALTQEQLRYRSNDQRFLPREIPQSLPPDQAVLTAAEITGQLLQIAPDRTYTLEEFHQALQKKQQYLQNDPDLGDRQLFTIMKLVHALQSGYKNGLRPKAFRGATQLQPENIAALYLFSLELLQNQTV